MSLAFDEFGRPFIVVREQASKHRVKGIDAFKVHPLFISMDSNWIFLSTISQLQELSSTP